MIKHRGFPGRLPSTDFQFTIRRANPKGATPPQPFWPPPFISVAKTPTH
jgi:hypothetical protein